MKRPTVIVPLFCIPFVACAVQPLLLPGGRQMLSSGSAEEVRYELAAAGKSLAEDSSTEVWIVQFDPVKTMASAIRRMIAGAGATLLAPVSGGAYLVRATKAQQLAILNGGMVEATRPYKPADKGEPVESAKSLFGDASEGEGGESIYIVNKFSDVDEEEFFGKLSLLGGCEVLDRGEGCYRVKMNDAGYGAVAALTETEAICQWHEPRFYNDIAIRDMHVASIWPSAVNRAHENESRRHGGPEANIATPVPVPDRRGAVHDDLFSAGLLTPDGREVAPLSRPSAAAPSESLAPASAAPALYAQVSSQASSSASEPQPLGLTGKGQLVAICDSGLDTGDLETLHPDIRGRVVKTFAYGRPSDIKNWSGDWSDESGHGTHVAGSVLGNGSASGGKYAGSAFEAEVVFQSTGGKQYWGKDKRGNRVLMCDLTGFVNLFRARLNPCAAVLLHPYIWAMQNNRRLSIHSDSWGSNAAGAYDEPAADFDEVVFGYCPDLLPVVSAGNEGKDEQEPFGIIDPGSIGSPATAKNILTVGAAESFREKGGYAQSAWGRGWPKDFPFKPISEDLVSHSASGCRGMAAFSSRGPCKDGRVKPDVVAPGTDILSMRSRAKPQLPATWGSFDDYYHFMGGTSMSAPLVSGTAVLVREWLVERKAVANPDAATIKALLCAGAKSLAPGQYGTGRFQEVPQTYPNNVEGWGMVDLANTVANPDGVAVRDAEIIAEGESLTYRVAAPGDRPLVILMAYTDAPSMMGAGGLVNDLDLSVTDPSGRKWYPNSKDGPDRVNNVEGVRYDKAAAGEYIVVVRAAAVQKPMDAKFTKGRENATRFSLVANGAKEIL